MGKTAMQPVIMAKWRGPKPCRLPLMFTVITELCFFFYCKEVTGLTHFNNDNSVFGKVINLQIFIKKPNKKTHC